MQLYSSNGVADIWTCAGTRTIYPYCQFSMVPLGYPWLYLVILGYLWLSLVILGYPWLSLVILGYSLLSLVIIGYPFKINANLSQIDETELRAF